VSSALYRRTIGVWLLGLVAACGKQGTCPTAESLGGSNAVARREAEIVAARCRADRWPEKVTDCLAQAKGEDALEGCLRQLSSENAANLKAAFAPLNAELDEAEHAALAEDMNSDIAALHLEELVARAAGCASYVDAASSAREALARCKSSASLEAFGLIQLMRKDVTEMRALTDPQQLADECTTRAKQLRDGWSPCTR